MEEPFLKKHPGGYFTNRDTRFSPLSPNVFRQLTSCSTPIVLAIKGVLQSCKLRNAEFTNTGMVYKTNFVHLLGQVAWCELSDVWFTVYIV